MLVFTEPHPRLRYILCHEDENIIFLSWKELSNWQNKQLCSNMQYDNYILCPQTIHDTLLHSNSSPMPSIHLPVSIKTSLTNSTHKYFIHITIKVRGKAQRQEFIWYYTHSYPFYKTSFKT